jgi:mannose-6-phosphate isomerase-like protein (cupin superfamily)
MAETIDHDGELARQLDSMLARRASRVEDWASVEFQAQAGEQFRRGVLRYVAPASPDGTNPYGTIESRGFTLSCIHVPPGGEGAEHVHGDAEEAFFMLEGSLRVAIHRGGEVAYRTISALDMVVFPPGVHRSFKNVGSVPALFCVMIGSGRPQPPQYPDTSPLHGLGPR